MAKKRSETETVLKEASTHLWFEITEPENEYGIGWPGDGSGLDDLADYNANEADDYRSEGE